MRFAAVIGLCLLLSAPASSAAPVKIMAMGDSITRGWGSSDGGGYRNLLRNRLTAAGWDVDLVGRVSSGVFPDNQHDAWDGIKLLRLAQESAPFGAVYDPHVTLLMMGTNDIWTGTGPDAPQHAPANLNTLIGRIFQFNPDTQLYVSSILRMHQGGSPTEDPLVNGYNAQIPGIVASWRAAGKSIRFVDIYPRVGRLDLADGVHPNATGYAKIADAWFDALTVPLPPADDIAIRKLRGNWHTPTVPEPGAALGAVAVSWLIGITQRRQARRRSAPSVARYGG